MKIPTLLTLTTALLLSSVSLQSAPHKLTEDKVRNVILGWFATTNEHHPVEELLAFADENIEFHYPNLPEPQKGREALRAWYEDVLQWAFDETHEVADWQSIEIDGNRATVKLLVRWERREWKVGDAYSRYLANFSWQTYELAMDPQTGRIVVTKKTVDKFEPVAPIYQPAQ